MTFLELKEILLKDKPSKELRRRKDELALLIPEIAGTYNFDQKTVWHDLDVFEHILKVVDNVEVDIRVRIAALFHDIGKPDVIKIDEEGCGHFFGHWDKSEEIFKKYQDEFGLLEEDIYLVRKIIYYHDLSITGENILEFMKNFSSRGMELLFSIKEADIIAQNNLFLDDSLKKLNKALELCNNNFNFSDDYLDDTTSLMFARLCNNSYDVRFKAKNSTFKDFFYACINTPDGMLTYKVKLKYWDYFEIPEFDNFRVEDYNEKENFRKLKSLFKYKKKDR